MKHSIVLHTPYAAIERELQRAKLSGVPDSAARKQLLYGHARHSGYIQKTEIHDMNGNRVDPINDWRKATVDGKKVRGCFLLAEGKEYHVIEHWPPGNVESYRVYVDEEGVHRA